MTRKIIASMFVALLVSATLGGAFVSPALAQDDTTDCDSFDQLFGGCDESESSYLDKAQSAFTVYKAWTFNRDTVSMPWEEPADVQQQATSVQDYYNNHNSSFETYFNNQVSQSQYVNETVALELNFSNSEETATRHLVVSFDENGNATTSEVVNNTSETVEYSFDIEGQLSENADSELQTFHDEYVVDGKTVDKDYLSTKAGQYGCDIDSDASFVQKPDELKYIC